MALSADRSSEFLSLFLKVESRVYAYIRLQIPHQSDAEDVLQETATALWAKFDTYVPGTNFKAWAYQFARFEVQRYRNKRTRQERVFSPAFVDFLAARAEATADEYDGIRPMLAQCMQQLPSADREVVQRCYGSEATLATVAAQLGRPLNTIKSVLKRSRRALYECLQRAVNREDRS